MRIKNPFSKPIIFIFCLKKQSDKHYCFILFPLLLVLLIDLIFTLVGQPEIYWQNYNFYNEGSPLGIFFLSQHPGYFLLFYIFYVAVVLLVATNLKRPFNIVWAISFFLGHVWGSATWVDNIFYKFFPDYSFVDNWYLKIFYFILVGAISGFFIDHWLSKKTR